MKTVKALKQGYRFLKYIFLVCFFYSGNAQVTSSEISLVASDGLYFDGVKGVNYQFGQRITPHGTCIDVVNGYIYVSWYKGGMDKRNLMVSRKTVTGGTWKTITFPDKHFGYQGISTRGDSHNVAVIGINTIDNTVHILYDMHAYPQSLFPNNFFNYRVSTKGGAIVPDEEWTIALFSPKLNYLKSGANYSATTYPSFFRSDSGALFANWRLGGAGNGSDSYAVYDGTSWSSTTKFNNGNQPITNEKYSIYGSYNFFHGKFRAGFSVRYKDYGTNPAYEYNSGLFYGYSNDPFGASNWFNYKDQSVIFPVQSPKPLQFAEPVDIGLGNSITIEPTFTVTKNEAIHFVTTVSGKTVHYYKGPLATNFSYSEIPFYGDLLNFKQRVYLIGLKNGRPAIYSTPEGKDEWREDYYVDSGSTYRHGNIFLKDNKIFYFLMGVGTGSAQPIYVAQFDLLDTGSIPDAIKIEAEDYGDGIGGAVEQAEVDYHDFDAGNSGNVYRNDDVDISASASASNGYAVSQFKGDDWMQYSFTVVTPGNYYMSLFASNLQNADSNTKFTVDNVDLETKGIAITGDWNVYNENKSTVKVYLTAGVHTCKITQMTSLSSHPDKIVFSYDSAPLGIADFSGSTNKETVIVYPNPVNDFFTIQSPFANSNYDFVTVNGVVISSGTIEQFTKKIDVRGLQKGIYLLKIKSDRGTITKKIIKN